MRRILAALALLPLLLLTACGGSGDHNDADVTFAQQMIPHHEQAVFMTTLVPSAGASPEVTALAQQISAAQGPEIKQMKGWLKDWDADETSDHGDGHDMDSMDMGDGMASKDDLGTLATLSGAPFDTKWLTLMTAHHEGAIAMAKTEIADGQDPAAKKLAREIIDSQQKEIATMKLLIR